MLVAVFLLAFAGQAVAAKAVADCNEATVQGFAFHCNCDGGNGKTYIEGKDKDFGKKLDVSLTRNANDPTIWDVVVPAGEVWKCTQCGCTEWISFSNKSGVPDGKNIQLTHPAKEPATPIADPIDFSITVFHRVVGTGEYLVYPDVGETFVSTEEAYVEWLNDVNGFTFLNLYLAAIRNNNPADMARVEGFVCSYVTKDSGNFDMTVNGTDADITALIKPVANGHYEITFWYVGNTDKSIKDTEEGQAYLKYRAYVQLWNDFYHGDDTTKIYNDAVRLSLYNNGGIAHYNALCAFYGADNLPPYFAFQDFTDYVAAESVWTASLELGLIDALIFLGCDDIDAYLTGVVEAFGDTIPMDFWD